MTEFPKRGEAVNYICGVIVLQLWKFMIEYTTITFVSSLQVEVSQLSLPLWFRVTVFVNLKISITSWKLQVPQPVPWICYCWMLACDCTRPCHVLYWPLCLLPRKNHHFPLPWSEVWDGQIHWMCTALEFFFLFPSSCGCVARLLDSDPNNQVPGESKQQKRLSVQAVTSPLRNERAAVSHLCDPFSFLPLSWIKHCTCPWGGNICHTYWSAWMQIHNLFKNVYSLLFFF